MTNYYFYHNPNCSKSRAALQLLEDKGIQPTIIKYLEEPLQNEQLQKLLGKLGIGARELIRSTEDAYDEFGLGNMKLSEGQLIEAMVQAPNLIERPILATDNKAVIGRPTEKLLELIP